ncbi:MAG: type II toxin-antitoxin system RelE family toxin [Anaerolineae bacterium]
MKSSGRWRIEIKRQAEKTLNRLPAKLKGGVIRAIDSLAEEPRPRQCERLKGYDNLYRIPVGDWPISYAVEDERLVVLVLEIAARGSAYRYIRR